LSDEFTFDYQQEYEGRAIRLCTIEPNGRVRMFSSLTDIHPKSDWRIISLISEDKPTESN
jgi:hypothetical protein